MPECTNTRRHFPFQLTRPVWGEPVFELSQRPEFVHFNSLAPCGANRILRASLSHTWRFQLTRPVWGEPRAKRYSLDIWRISTHSPRVGRTIYITSSASTVLISTHSPRVGRTAAFAFCNACAIFISTHSPRVGRTRRRIQIHIKCKHFNSLAPCGANLGRVGIAAALSVISTHSPRVGRTACNSVFYAGSQ